MAKQTEMSADQLRTQISVIGNKLSKKKSAGIDDFALHGKLIKLQKQLLERVKYEHLAR